MVRSTGKRSDSTDAEPDRPEGRPEDLPGVTWGPGRNFYGWAMTLVLAGLVAGVAVAGFRLLGDTLGSPGPSDTVEDRKELERQVGTLGSDLCAASMESGVSPDASVQIFQQRIHGPLHALADALAEEDRPAATKLLRRKFNVEEDIRRKAPPAELAVTFAGLNESAMEGLRILSLPSPACAAPAPAPGAPPPPPPPAP